MTSSSGSVTVGSIVEGHGEQTALPKILYRIAGELGIVRLSVPTPDRRPRDSLIRPGGIETAVAAMAIRVTGPGGILVLIDADDACPATLGPQLLARAKKARPDKAVAVVLAKREFEAWYLAAAPSLAGKRGLPDPFLSPPDPESPRDCKGWLSRARIDGIKYSPTVDQAPLASAFDMEMARTNSPSFDKLYREVEFLLNAG